MTSKAKTPIQDSFHLEALGTTWTVVVEGTKLTAKLRRILSQQIQNFEATYSRFKPESQLNQLNRQNTSQPLLISSELAQMLEFGLRLTETTQGLFDANVAIWEKAYGYDETYSFKSVDDVTLPSKGWFEVQDQNLIKHGLVELDLGAFGKGFLIDLLAQTLEQQGLQFFLIDGGRDFFGTTKADGSGWQIGLQHPTDSKLAVGVANISHSALAGSNSYHRRVGEFHHLLDGQTGQPITQVASVFVTAKTAMEADGLSTAIFVSQPEIWDQLRHNFEFEYLALTEELKMMYTPTFPGELFLK